MDLDFLAGRLGQGEKDVLHRLLGQLREWVDRTDTRIFGTVREVIDITPEDDRDQSHS